MDHVDLGNGPAVDGPSQRGLALLLPEDGLDGAILEVDQLLENLSALEMLDAAEGRFVLVRRRRWDVAAIPVDEDGTSASFPNVLFDAPANSIVVLVGQPAIAAAAVSGALAVDDGAIAMMGAPNGRVGWIESNLFRHGSGWDYYYAIVLFMRVMIKQERTDMITAHTLPEHPQRHFRFWKASI